MFFGEECGGGGVGEGCAEEADLGGEEGGFEGGDVGWWRWWCGGGHGGVGLGRWSRVCRAREQEERAMSVACAGIESLRERGFAV